MTVSFDREWWSNSYHYLEDIYVVEYTKGFMGLFKEEIKHKVAGAFKHDDSYHIFPYQGMEIVFPIVKDIVAELREEGEILKKKDVALYVARQKERVRIAQEVAERYLNDRETRTG